MSHKAHWQPFAMCDPPRCFFRRGQWSDDVNGNLFVALHRGFSVVLRRKLPPYRVSFVSQHLLHSNSSP